MLEVESKKGKEDGGLRKEMGALLSQESWTENRPREKQQDAQQWESPLEVFNYKFKVGLVNTLVVFLQLDQLLGYSHRGGRKLYLIRGGGYK